MKIAPWTAKSSVRAWSTSRATGNSLHRIKARNQALRQDHQTFSGFRRRAPASVTIKWITELPPFSITVGFSTDCSTPAAGSACIREETILPTRPLVLATSKIRLNLGGRFK